MTRRTTRPAADSAADELRPIVRGGTIEDPIFRAIRETIVAGRLPPGTKLGEDQLGGAFGVSRTRIRQSLQLLSAAGLVTLFPHRGAFVARPSRRDATETYAARCLIEGELVAVLARSSNPSMLKQLRAHLKQQRQAEAAGDRLRFVTLIGEFHLLLAGLAGNRVLAQVLGQLVARTSLIISLYEPPTEHARTGGCAVDEHVGLIDRIAAGDARGAARLMTRHLHAVQGRLQLDRTAETTIDLMAVFSTGTMQIRKR